jgi:hypothetical protein
MNRWVNIRWGHNAPWKLLYMKMYINFCLCKSVLCCAIVLPPLSLFFKYVLCVDMCVLSQDKIALVWLKENSEHSHLTVEDTTCKQLLGGHRQHTAVVGQIVTEGLKAGLF